MIVQCSSKIVNTKFSELFYWREIERCDKWIDFDAQLLLSLIILLSSS